MPLSPEKIQRAEEAVVALSALRKEYADVLVVLDYVSIKDIANYELETDEPAVAGAVLDEEALDAIFWRLGKYVGSSEVSANLLPNMLQMALDEHERRSL